MRRSAEMRSARVAVASGLAALPSLRCAGAREGPQPPSHAPCPCGVRALGETGAMTDAEQVARGILAQLQDGFVAHDLAAVTTLLDDEVVVFGTAAESLDAPDPPRPRHAAHGTGPRGDVVRRG